MCVCFCIFFCSSFFHPISNSIRSHLYCQSVIKYNNNNNSMEFKHIPFVTSQRAYQWNKQINVDETKTFNKNIRFYFDRKSWIKLKCAIWLNVEARIIDIKHKKMSSVCIFKYSTIKLWRFFFHRIIQHNLIGLILSFIIMHTVCKSLKMP